MSDSTDSLFPVRLDRIRLEAGGRALLDDVSAVFAHAPVTAVLGPNGAGKTLLMRVCRGLVEPAGGTVRWGVHRPRALGVRIGYVPQNPVMLRRSVRANVAYALQLAGIAPGQRRTRIGEVLGDVRLEALARTGAHNLSGGERQRLAIARAWAQGPEALLLDEPTAHLDPASAAAIERTVARVRATGTRIVLCTHDLAQARRLADEVVFMHCGRIREHARTADFFERPASAEAERFIAGELLTAVTA